MTITDRLSHQRTTLRAFLDAGDIEAALRYLNTQTALRFTALYRFSGPTLQNRYLVDANNPVAMPLPDLPILASYCVYIRQTAHPFVTTDAAADDRVRDHPKRHEIRAYCGVPIMQEDGTLFGSLCHFDIDPTPVGDEVVALLEIAADLLKTVVGASSGGHAPATPRAGEPQ